MERLGLEGEKEKGQEEELSECSPVGFSNIATMPTPSTSEFAGRVRRSACSQVRCTPLGSL
jgi:hypothetical protein